MAAGAVTTTEAANYLPTLWSLEVIDEYYANFVLLNLVDQSYKELAKAGYGNKVRVPICSAPAGFTTITEGSGVTQYTQNVETYKDIDVTTYQGLRLSWPSIVDIQTQPSLRQNYTRMMGIEAAKAIDATLAALIDNFSQTVGTLATDLGDDEILRAEQYLDDANAPLEDRFLVLSPAALMNLYKVEKYANSLYRQTSGNLDGSKGKGFIGKLYRSDVYESSAIEGSNAAGHDNGMWQRKAIAAIVQQEPKVEQWRNVASAMDEVIVWALWGSVEMRDTSGVWVKGP
jgi:hypothetical protein